MRGRLASLAAAAARWSPPSAARAAERPVAGRRPRHRRALRRADRARPRRPRTPRPRTSRAPRARLRRRAARHAARGRPGRRRGDRRRPARRRARPSTRGDQTALAAARGTVRAGLFRGAYAVIAEATAPRRRRDREALAAAARVPHRDALHPPGRAGDARARPARARQAHAAGRRAGRQEGPARRLPGAAARAARTTPADGIEQDLPARRAEAAAQAAGYFAILAPRYAEDRGAAAEKQASRGLRRAARGRRRTSPPRSTRPTRRSRASPPRPFTPEEAARRAQQLLQFLALVPVEYGRGVKGDQVTRDFEITEAVAFRTGAVGAFGDLRDQLAKRDRARTDGGAAALDRARPAGRDREQAARRACRRPSRSRRSPTRRTSALTAAMPKAVDARRPTSPTTT